MKKFKKVLSVVLAVMMIMCAVSVSSVSATAAETTTTIYFAAPIGTSTANTWSSASLYYGSTTSMSSMTKIALSKTGKVYTGSKGNLTTLKSGEWEVMSVTLTSSQVSAINNSKYVGFVNQNERKTGLKNSIRKATVSGTYADKDASITSFNGKMFVINGCYDTTEIGSYTVKVVNSTGQNPAQGATIYFAAPRGTNIANSWRNAQLYYGSTTTVGKLKRIDMQRTGKVYAGDKGSLKTIVSDDWDVYSVKLTSDQIDAIDKEKYVGFINANNRKTGLKNTILKATESGEYASAKSSIASYNGKMFVLNGCYDTSSEITTYNVKVLSNNTGVAPAKSSVTLYFAAPLSTTTANTWKSASLFYGNDQKSMSGNTKLEMTKTGDTYAGDKGKLKTIISGNWDVYSVTLNAEQINRIDYAKYVGFISGYSRKTGYMNPLQKATESGTYADVPLSIADYDGKLFVINGSYLASEISSYTVKAIDYKTSPKNTIKATSNVGTASSCTYSSSNKQVTVTYTLKSSMLIENIQAIVKYDSKVLKLASTNTKKTISPAFYGTSGGGFEGNLNLSNMIKFNATNPDGYDFTKGQTVFTAVFDIVGSGNTEVNLDVYVLTATQNDKDVKLVYRDEVLNDNFTLTSKAVV